MIAAADLMAFSQAHAGSALQLRAALGEVFAIFALGVRSLALGVLHVVDGGSRPGRV